VVISAIAGTAGVGKTALAVHWARRVADRFPDGQLYVNLRGFDPGGQVMNPTEAIRAFLDALGVPAQRIPTSLDAQAALYRSLLAGKRVLIVLDNAAGAGQVRPLLPAAGGCHVLVTSRDRLSGLVARDGAKRVTVPPMTDDEALELLESVAGPRFDRIAATDIVRSCGHIPLALRVAAENMASRQRSPLDGHGGGTDEATTLRTVLSWSYRRLTPAAADALQRLAVTGSGTISPATAAGVLGTGIGEADALLDALAEIHLLHEVLPGAYRLDQLTAAFAAELAEVWPLRPVPHGTRAQVRRLPPSRLPRPLRRTEDAVLDGSA
jgi:hypothetical protein